MVINKNYGAKQIRGTDLDAKNLRRLNMESELSESRKLT